MIKLRTSSSIEPFRERAEKALGLERYDWRVSNYNEPVVFLGLYHNGDWKSFLQPRVKRYVLWCGGDIRNFKRGYYYGDGKGLWKSKISRLFNWQKKIIRTEAEHFCENNLQREALEKCGIRAKVVPAFWGNIKDFPVSFERTEPFTIWICGHPGREKEYGWEIAKRMQVKFPEVKFVFYGVDRILTEEEFNNEIQKYHCLLRLNEHDGFSDCLAKSILMGQFAISKVKHKYIPSYETEEELENLIKLALTQTKPNLKARNYYLKAFNKYPFL